MDGLQPQIDASQVAYRPNPDPTLLTTEQTERMKEILRREISSSREIVETQLNGLRQIFETRTGGLERDMVLLQARAERLQTTIQVEIGHLERLHQEKFDSITTQFKERDTRTEQTSRDSKVAVDAALQAAKETVGEQNKSNALAIAKSEATFTKQIDQIGVLVTSMGKGFDDKIDDIKSRLQSMESQKKGAGDVWAIWFAATGFAIGIGGVLVTAITFIFSKIKI